MKCRFCSATQTHVFVDLISAPASNAYLSASDLIEPELYFPLKLYVCHQCWLVQLPAHRTASQMFPPDYAYFSSYSSSWLAHAERLASLAIERLGVDKRSLVLEVGSNDGYLLQYIASREIPCVGVEPTTNTAAIARARGIETVEAFFGAEFAASFTATRGHVDLLIANNVLAHVPDINDFVSGLKKIVAKGGALILEFPHLMQLVSRNQFDTIYHEHYSYFSFTAAERILAAHDLRVWDVEHLPTHGGSLRLWVVHDDDPRESLLSGAELLALELSAGTQSARYYSDFQRRADGVKNDFLEFVLRARREGKRIAAYGAAAKGNTLLNYCGIKPDLLPFVVDKSPHKQGKFLPGSRIPIVDEGRLRADRPEYIVVLPWNLLDEIEQQLIYVKEWGGRLVVAVPELRVSS